MNDYHQTVIEAVTLVGLLDADGALIELDSLMVADLAVALEQKLAIKIPMAALTEETFASIDSIAKMVSDLHMKTKVQTGAVG